MNANPNTIIIFLLKKVTKIVIKIKIYTEFISFTYPKYKKFMSEMIKIVYNTYILCKNAFIIMYKNIICLSYLYFQKGHTVQNKYRELRVQHLLSVYLISQIQIG